MVDPMKTVNIILDDTREGEDRINHLESLLLWVNREGLSREFVDNLKGIVRI